MSQSTYYTCNGCDHATFKLSEAIQHFAEMGKRHTPDSAPLTFIREEWQQLFAQPEVIYVGDDGYGDGNDYDRDDLTVVRWR